MGEAGAGGSRCRLIREDDTASGDLMAKVASQLEVRMASFLQVAGARQRWQMTKLDYESWNGWLPSIAGLEIWTESGKGGRAGGTGCSFKAT